MKTMILILLAVATVATAQTDPPSAPSLAAGETIAAPPGDVRDAGVQFAAAADQLRKNLRDPQAALQLAKNAHLSTNDIALIREHLALRQADAAARKKPNLLATLKTNAPDLYSEITRREVRAQAALIDAGKPNPKTAVRMQAIKSSRKFAEYFAARKGFPPALHEQQAKVQAALDANDSAAITAALAEAQRRYPAVVTDSLRHFKSHRLTN